MKKIFALLFAIIISSVLYAQNENDALRYSLLNYSGTARFSGMSGAYGAVGANISSLSQNPAGIGLYRKSEFTISPVLSSNNTESNYLGNMNNDSRTTLYLGNVGYVMSIKLNDKNSNLVKQVQFGFGLNRTAMFNNRIIVSGLNSKNSLIKQYLDDADASGSNPDDLVANYGYGAGLASQTQLIYLDANNVWQADLPNGGLYQTKSIETSGGMTETVLSAGTNIADKLFLGMTFAFPHINYHEQSYYTEKDNDNLSPYLKSLERSEYLDTRGTGFNFKIGFIYKPVDFIRIGGAFHTPTTYNNMHDSYGATMTGNYDQPPLTTSNSTHYVASSPDGYFDYAITTPMRALGSLAFIIGQYGLISADYEYIDYSTARLRANSYSFQNENNAISNSYTAASNLRFGTEWKAGIYAFRGGYSLYGSPYKNESMTGSGSRTGFSFGFGIQEKAYSVDFSYNHMNSKDKYYIYGYAPASNNTYNSNSYSLTVGFRL